MLKYNEQELIDFLYKKLELLPSDLYDDFQWNWDSSWYCDDPADLVEDRGYARADEGPQYAAAKIMNCAYKTGATKMVFFFDEYPDIVVKIPYRGTAYIGYDNPVLSYNDEFTDAIAEVEDTEDFWDCWDYCSLEPYYYHKSKIYGVDSLLVDVAFLGEICDIPVYIAERVTTCNIAMQHKYSDQDLDSAASMKRTHPVDCYESVLAEIIAEYGVDICSQFLNFLRQMNINDIHEGNIGYDKNNKIKILDYSGFRE